MNFHLIRLAGEAATNATAAATSGTGTNPNASANGGGFMALLTTFAPFILIFVIMYFLMIRPQKKKQKEEQQMRNNLRVGDELTTIGGICGRVVNIKDDTITVESGVDRCKIVFKKWAIQSVETKHDAPLDDDDDDDDDI